MFFEDALQPQQKRAGLSLSLESETYYEHRPTKLSITIHPYARIDSNDSERSTVDGRELYVRQVIGKLNYSVGVRRVFWGATESAHLVDVINQSDLAENPDGEDKLGQPMVQVGYRTPIGTVEAFYLPVFRERRFPGRDGRLRVPALLDDRNAVIDSRRGHGTNDYALRFSGTEGYLDYGLSYFRGINRMPRFAPILTPDGVRASPQYERISQAGLEATYASGDWLWKLEAIRQNGPSESYWAGVGGFEYTINGVFSSDADLGLLAEYLGDERRHSFYAPFENDLFIGTRLGLNDEASTDVLLGAIFDLGSGSTYGSIEASRRASSNSKLSLEIRLFQIDDPEDPAFELRRESYGQLEWTIYF